MGIYLLVSKSMKKKIELTMKRTTLTIHNFETTSYTHISLHLLFYILICIKTNVSKNYKKIHTKSPIKFLFPTSQHSNNTSLQKKFETFFLHDSKPSKNGKLVKNIFFYNEKKSILVLIGKWVFE